jgi:phosphate transport system protein
MKKSPELARNVLLSNDGVDTLRDRMYREVVKFMEWDTTMIHSGIDYIFIARGFERLADHATNIAEDVLFCARSIDVSHNQNII